MHQPQSDLSCVQAAAVLSGGRKYSQSAQADGRPAMSLRS